MTNCLFFGDSITYGENDGILGGWVDHLKRIYHGKYYAEGGEKVNIFNLGIGGEHTGSMLLRLENEMIPRLSPERNMVFISYGANDLVVHNNMETVSVEGFENNISKAVDIAKRYTDVIFLQKILPISATIDGVVSVTGKLRTNSRIHLYNKVLESVSTQKKVELVDNQILFLNHTDEYLSTDGIHPNEKGYKIISENMERILSAHF